MIGAICGDIIGSFRSSEGILCEKNTFTHNTVLLAAVCDTLLKSNRSPESMSAALIERNGRINEYAINYKNYFKKYPELDYSQSFSLWASDMSRFRQSCADNIAAARAIPIAFAYETLREVEYQAKLSCISSHDNPDAIISAQAIASAVFLAYTGETKDNIKKHIEKKFPYKLSPDMNIISSSLRMNIQAQYTARAGIVCFLHSVSYEDALKLALSLGGDTATVCCIAGAIASAYYKKPAFEHTDDCLAIIDAPLLSVFNEFCKRFTVRV